ncbi:MAG TPA: hypothetical protein VGK14_11530 [Novimethylophilus sp.]|jgi:hypothetical protein|uniref:hypothetical protein n=1 Tax=Novimethylophilus sp. TaxID=2137426 RepID=UPI002F42E789
MKRDLPVSYRMPLLMAGFICLALGIGSGLWRLGWQFPLPSTDLSALHGSLMAGGFLGTVIALERSVAIGQRWAYLAPFSTALGGLALVAGFPWQIGAGLLAAGGVVFAAASVQVFLRQRALFTLTLLLGALCWLLGSLLWLGGLGIAQVVPWWIGFLVLTIAGERLELSRFLPPSPNSKMAFFVIIAVFLAGTLLASLSSTGNPRLLATALFALALWFLRQDVARRTIRQQGLTRFIAACLLSGYAWLLVGAVIGLFTPQLMPGSSYDAFLHAVLLGFVFSMIFGHAPIILPAVARIKMAYHPTFYVPLLVLHVSLAARIAGDLLQIPHCRSAGGALNALALLLFVLSTVGAVIRGNRQIARAER